MSTNARTITAICAWALMVFALVASVAVHAQVISYEPGSEPPADTWTVTQPARQTTPPVDIELNSSGTAPALQRAHSGRYTALSGPLHVIDYRQDAAGDAQVIVMLADGRYVTGEVQPAGRAQVLVPLFDGDDPAGVIKLGATQLGERCARLLARAVIFGQLRFPADANADCSPGPGLGLPGQRYCIAQVFGSKLGEAGAGPETCLLLPGA